MDPSQNSAKRVKANFLKMFGKKQIAMSPRIKKNSVKIISFESCLLSFENIIKRFKEKNLYSSLLGHVPYQHRRYFLKINGSFTKLFDFILEFSSSK